MSARARSPRGSAYAPSAARPSLPDLTAWQAEQIPPQVLEIPLGAALAERDDVIDLGAVRPRLGVRARSAQSGCSANTRLRVACQRLECYSAAACPGRDRRGAGVSALAPWPCGEGHSGPVSLGRDTPAQRRRGSAYLTRSPGSS